MSGDSNYLLELPGDKYNLVADDFDSDKDGLVEESFLSRHLA